MNWKRFAYVHIYLDTDTIVFILAADQNIQVTVI